MQALTETTVASLPSPLSPAVARGIAMLVSKLAPPITPSCSTYSIAVADAPSPETRDGLERRMLRLDSWLQPAGPKRTLVEVTALFTAMARSSGDATKADAELNIYVADLADLPFFALSEACKAFRQGIVGDGKWVPKPGEIRIEAAKRVASLAKERREIAAILEAKIVDAAPSEDRRKAVADMARQVAREVSMGGILAERARREERCREEEARDEKARLEREAEQARLNALIAAGHQYDQPLPQLSEESRRKFVSTNIGDGAAA